MRQTQVAGGRAASELPEVGGLQKGFFWISKSGWRDYFGACDAQSLGLSHAERRGLRFTKRSEGFSCLPALDFAIEMGREICLNCFWNHKAQSLPQGACGRGRRISTFCFQCVCLSLCWQMSHSTFEPIDLCKEMRPAFAERGLFDLRGQQPGVIHPATPAESEAQSFKDWTLHSLER